MKLLKSIVKNLHITYCSILPFLKLAPSKRIVIVGHMRSGSSLLSHILLSNPDIIGIGETQSIYTDKKYHARLLSSVLIKKRALWVSGKRTYVMDKVLHDFIVDDSILKDENTLIILLIRSPDGAIPSIVSAYKKLPSFKGKTQQYIQEKSFSHYIDRLNFVLDTQKKYNSRCFFVDYSDFLINYETILEKLSRFLHLKEPLKSSYQLNEFTGKLKIGDWSQNIFSGKILGAKEKEKSHVELADLNLELMKKAQGLYDNLKSLLLVK